MKKRRGFMLLELIFAVAIFAVMLLVMAMLFKAGMSSFLHGYFSTNLLEEAGAVFSGNGPSRGLISYIREADVLLEASPGKISFTVDGDTVTYFMDGGRILKKTVFADEVLSEHAENLSFLYYTRSDDAWVTAVSSSDVTAIRVRADFSRGGSKLSHSSSAFLRHGAK